MIASVPPLSNRPPQGGAPVRKSRLQAVPVDLRPARSPWARNQALPLPPDEAHAVAAIPKLRGGRAEACADMIKGIRGGDIFREAPPIIRSNPQKRRV